MNGETGNLFEVCHFIIVHINSSCRQVGDGGSRSTYKHVVADLMHVE